MAEAAGPCPVTDTVGISVDSPASVGSPALVRSQASVGSQAYAAGMLGGIHSQVDPLEGSHSRDVAVAGNPRSAQDKNRGAEAGQHEERAQELAGASGGAASVPAWRAQGAAPAQGVAPLEPRHQWPPACGSPR
eukprot:scaffold6732_cov99-Isochrysis_galbana.AAC.6